MSIDVHFSDEEFNILCNILSFYYTASSSENPSGYEGESSRLCKRIIALRDKQHVEAFAKKNPHLFAPRVEDILEDS